MSGLEGLVSNPLDFHGNQMGIYFRNEGKIMENEIKMKGNTRKSGEK